MNQEEAREFIQHYFAELFGKHNIEALDEFLHPDYFDDDISDPHVNHLQNSKEYLRALFVA